MFCLVTRMYVYCILCKWTSVITNTCTLFDVRSSGGSA